MHSVEEEATYIHTDNRTFSKKLQGKARQGKAKQSKGNAMQCNERFVLCKRLGVWLLSLDCCCEGDTETCTLSILGLLEHHVHNYLCCNINSPCSTAIISLFFSMI